MTTKNIESVKSEKAKRAEELSNEFSEEIKIATETMKRAAIHRKNQAVDLIRYTYRRMA